ncbi:hypothetical protein [Caldivirga sp. UBA161]|uniref:hypothetical protein n=1 Tax=Caldivirga sp. UBA161 TaxID=1915569 RepID=UPI0025BBFC11|nr:hypothetical protein [Caldivirga sp. UBA161]
MIELKIPIPHEWIIIGAVGLLIEMAVGFIIQIRRGMLSLSSLSNFIPIRGPIRNWGSGGALIAALATAFAYPFYGAPMTSCHSQSSYLSRPRIKAIAHALIWWGFALAAVSTTLGFAFDEWVNSTTFIPGGKLGQAGPYAVIGTGGLGGVLIVVGFALMMVSRWQGTRPIDEPALTDVFLWLAFLTALSGFGVMGVELTIPGNYLAVESAFGVHIIIVLLMFATMPWTKFGHAIYMYVWQAYDRYRAWRGIEPRLLGPWSGELAEKALHSHHPAHKSKVTG